MTKEIIGVFGAGNVSDTDEEWQSALIIGRQLAEKGYVVLTGGLGGVMTAASKGAKEAGGSTVGILPGDAAAAANPWIALPIVTDMGHARNVILVHSSEAMVAVGF